MEFILKGEKAVRGKAAGEAVVCKDNVCFVGSIDKETGLFNEKGHGFSGKYMKGKVMVYPTGKGSTGGSYSLYAACMNGAGPCAIINNELEMITAAGAILAKLPVVHHIQGCDPTDVIKDGDWVEVDADNGIIKVTRNEE